MCMMRREVFMDFSFYYNDMALTFQWVCEEIYTYSLFLFIL